jgi:hypothetical protein
MNSMLTFFPAETICQFIIYVKFDPVVTSVKKSIEYLSLIAMI